jgi:hypothetical protein
VGLDDPADAGAVEGPTDRVSGFGPPYSVRVERNGNEDATPASVGDGRDEPPPPGASILVTRLATTAGGRPSACFGVAPMRHRALKRTAPRSGPITSFRSAIPGYLNENETPNCGDASASYQRRISACFGSSCRVIDHRTPASRPHSTYRGLYRPDPPASPPTAPPHPHRVRLPLQTRVN